MPELIDLMQRLQEANARVDANPLDLSSGKPGVQAHNKRMDAVWAALRELAATPEGRTALEELAVESPSMGLRVMTANMMMRWDDSLARDVLEKIVVDGGGEVIRPMTMATALRAPDGVRGAALSLLNLNRPLPG